MLKILDFLFIAFHTILILFNLFGWIFIKTRKFNLFMLLLTGASWFILGIFYGIGYCPFTDWHFRLLEKSGETGLPDSYIAYMIERFTGHTFRGIIIDRLTMICYAGALCISLFLNLKHGRKKEGTDKV